MNEALQTRGRYGEELVAEHLVTDGFVIIDRNYHSPFGEIDLIAVQNNLYAFIEVKLRTANYFPLSQVVNHTKQKKIIKTAHHYIAKHDIQNALFRFDVALVEAHNNQYTLTYIPHAFTPLTGQESYI